MVGIMYIIFLTRLLILPHHYVLLGEIVTWLNNSSNAILWKNNSDATISWYGGGGYTLYKTDAKQWGKYLGMTVTSTGANFVINGFEYEHELRVRF